MPVEERKISIDEVFEASKKGKLDEAFCTGTAAVISPVGEFIMGDKKIVVNDNKIGKISQKLFDTLTGIQYGRIKDEFGWMTEVK